VYQNNVNAVNSILAYYQTRFKSALLWRCIIS